jgi:hypothetical protein
LQSHAKLLIVGQDFHALLNKTAERRIDVLSDSQTNTSKWLDEAFHRISHINQTGIECSFIRHQFFSLLFYSTMHGNLAHAHLVLILRNLT